MKRLAPAPAAPQRSRRRPRAERLQRGGSLREFGGRYNETLVEAHRELEVAYKKCKADPAFQAEVAEMRKQYIGGPTPLYFAKNLTKCGGAQIWLKCEELAFTGAHKINNAVDRGCSRCASARSASSQRPAPASTASPPPLCALCSASSASCTWAPRTSSVRV